MRLYIIRTLFTHAALTQPSVRPYKQENRAPRQRGVLARAALHLEAARCLLLLLVVEVILPGCLVVDLRGSDHFSCPPFPVHSIRDYRYKTNMERGHENDVTARRGCACLALGDQEERRGPCTPRRVQLGPGCLLLGLALGLDPGANTPALNMACCMLLRARRPHRRRRRRPLG